MNFTTLELADKWEQNSTESHITRYWGNLIWIPGSRGGPDTTMTYWQYKSEELASGIISIHFITNIFTEQHYLEREEFPGSPLSLEEHKKSTVIDIENYTEKRRNLTERELQKVLTDPDMILDVLNIFLPREFGKNKPDEIK